jgi:hypothetical protein
VSDEPTKDQRGRQSEAAKPQPQEEFLVPCRGCRRFSRRRRFELGETHPQQGTPAEAEGQETRRLA